MSLIEHISDEIIELDINEIKILKNKIDEIINNWKNIENGKNIDIKKMNNKDILEKNKDISNEEIIKDIKDTQKEIGILNNQITERQIFINKLKFLLMLRKLDNIDEIMKL